MSELRINIIIPSLDPDERLITLIKELQAHDIGKIFVINDGSEASYLPFFEQVEALGCTLYHHACNLGKGRALKSAMNAILLQSDENQGFVCVDSDGQHQIADIIKVIECLKQHPNALILGIRDFHVAGIPARSRIGNVVTSKLMSILCGIHIQDTQTGLRAYTSESARKFLLVNGERFEYEFHILFECHQQQIEMIQVPIRTIYLKENESSHFQPLRDSFRIYQVFLKFMISSFGSAILDVLLFSIFVSIMKPSIVQYIWIATILARIVSSIFNFTVNKRSVFKLKKGSMLVTVKYFMLCAMQMIVSAGLVYMLYASTHQAEALIKIIVDGGLFFISFVIQREWIFKS